MGCSQSLMAEAPGEGVETDEVLSSTILPHSTASFLQQMPRQRLSQQTLNTAES